MSLPPTVPVVPPGQINFPDSNLGGGQIPTGNTGTNLVRSNLFLIRSPKEALLVGLTMLLIAGAIAATWRRRTLIRSLGSLDS